MKKVSWWHVLLMFLLLSISGNPYINGAQRSNFFLIALTIIPVVHMIRNYHKSVSYNTILIFIFFMGYEVMHSLMFQLDYTLTFFKLFLKLLLAFAIVDILKDRFIAVLTKTMVIISLISFVFVLLCYIPGINKFLYNLAENLFPIAKNYKNYSTPTLIIFTFHPEYFSGAFSYVRNAGIFWESGAFAVFLNITLFLNYITRTNKSVKDLLDKNSIILIIALISTTSTMGLTVLIVLFTFFSTQLKTAVKYILLVFIALASYLAFSSIEFLGTKVSKQLSESRVKSNRFGSALMDLEDFSKRPLFGSSRRMEMTFGTDVYSRHTHRPNGTTNLLREYGLVYFSVYFLLIFHSYRNIFEYHNHLSNFAIPAFGVVLLWMVGFSETIFDLPFFKSLIFLSFVYVPVSKVITKKPFFYNSTPNHILKKLKST